MHTGIPVCVGMAPTKTLAKMANRLPKKNRTVLNNRTASTNKMQFWEETYRGRKGNLCGAGKQKLYEKNQPGNSITITTVSGVLEKGFSRQQKRTFWILHREMSLSMQYSSIT